MKNIYNYSKSPLYRKLLGKSREERDEIITSYVADNVITRDQFNKEISFLSSSFNKYTFALSWIEQEERTREDLEAVLPFFSDNYFGITNIWLKQQERTGKDLVAVLQLFYGDARFDIKANWITQGRKTIEDFKSVMESLTDRDEKSHMAKCFLMQEGRTREDLKEAMPFVENQKDRLEIVKTWLMKEATTREDLVVVLPFVNDSDRSYIARIWSEQEGRTKEDKVAAQLFITDQEQSQSTNATRAISIYKNYSDRIFGALNFQLSLNVSAEEREREVEELNDFLRKGSIREDSKNEAFQASITVGQEISKEETIKLLDAMKGLSVGSLSIQCREIDRDVVEALGQVINPEMKELSLAGSNFVERGAELGIILPSLENISHLNLRNTNFDSSGAQGLRSLIETSQSLINLNLERSNFGNSIKELWPAISQNPKIEFVNLVKSGIDSEGIEGMADAILETDKRLSLELSDNKVGNEGAKEIARLIEGDRLLSSKLDLSGMRIGNEGFCAIVDSLVNNQKITTLDLSSNSKITKKSLNRAAEKFRQNAFLTEITLNSELWPSYLPSDVTESVMRNRTINDAVSDYSKSVLAPILVRALYKNKGSEIILSDRVIKSLNEITKEKLFEGLTSAQIIEFSDHWHEPLQQTRSSKSKDYSEDSWTLLFGEDKKEIEVGIEGMEGWKLVTRNTPAELKKEGSDLDHCVGGYSGKCLEGNSHIISVVNPEGTSVSTIEIETNYANRKFEQKQHFGKGNSTISTESKSIEDWLYKEIEEGRISIDYASLEASRKKRAEEAEAKKGGQAKMVIGFDPLNSDKIKSVRRTFKEMLPEGNQKIRDNFSALVALEEIEIEGRKYNLSALEKRTKAELTVEEKDRKISDETAKVLGEIQKSLDVIFRENVLQASIQFPSEDKKTRKNQFGQVVLEVLETENTSKTDPLGKIKKIFGNNNVDVSDDGFIIISKITPKKVMDKLKIFAETQDEEKPSVITSAVSEEKLVEKENNRGG